MAIPLATYDVHEAGPNVHLIQWRNDEGNFFVAAKWARQFAARVECAHEHQNYREARQCALDTWKKAA